MLTQTNSQELQWSQFIANEHNSLLESSSKNFLAQNPLALFSSFEELHLYLSSNPDLLKLKDLGFTLLYGYDESLYIQLYKEVSEIDKPIINDTKLKLLSQIIYPNEKKYTQAILECQKYIYEGDIYQANISHEFGVQLLKPYTLEQIKDFVYSRLRKLNPANYMAIADFKDWLVFSSSPESLLKIEGKDQEFLLTSSPIKGTALLSQSACELRSSKEIAEHIMIVDLIRNDLGRISVTGSVEVKNLLRDSRHTNLQHLISDVESTLKKELIHEINGVTIPDFKEIFKAMFPGGSITGAPKIKSMELIKELEDKPRGAFTGSLGYYKFNQQAGEFNILIRSIFYNKKSKVLSFNTGAGITSASNPKQEYEETLLKAEKLIEVFNGI